MAAGVGGGPHGRLALGHGTRRERRAGDRAATQTGHRSSITQPDLFRRGSRHRLRRQVTRCETGRLVPIRCVSRAAQTVAAIESTRSRLGRRCVRSRSRWSGDGGGTFVGSLASRRTAGNGARFIRRSRVPATSRFGAGRWHNSARRMGRIRLAHLLGNRRVSPDRDLGRPAIASSHGA